MRVTSTGQDSIAAELDAAYREGPTAVLAFMQSRFAERVEVLHEPPLPTDGVYERDVVLAAQAQQQDVKERVVADYSEVATVSGDNAEVVVVLRVTGRLPDGSALRIDSRDTLTLREERIVRLVSAFDPEQMQPLLKALT
jgi:hypothetical protein